MNALVIPLLCKFWREDGVWNAIVQDLPIAVFASELSSADRLLKQAIREHFETLTELGLLDETIGKLAEHISSTIPVADLLEPECHFSRHTIVLDSSEDLAVVA